MKMTLPVQTVPQPFTHTRLKSDFFCTGSRRSGVACRKPNPAEGSNLMTEQDTSECCTVEYPLSALTDGELERIAAQAKLWGPQALAFAAMCYEAVRAECLRRQANRDAEKQIQPPGEGFVVNFGFWSDRDIGDALIGCTSLTYSEPVDAKIGEFIDAWMKAVAKVATYRLRMSRDPRNGSTFLDRVAAAAAEQEKGDEAA